MEIRELCDELNLSMVVFDGSGRLLIHCNSYQVLSRIRKRIDVDDDLVRRILVM